MSCLKLKIASLVSEWRQDNNGKETCILYAFNIKVTPTCEMCIDLQNYVCFGQNRLLYSRSFTFSIGITLDDDYFTLDRDWSLLTFLLYRQQCDDFFADKCNEHKRYIYNLSAIINSEDSPEIAVERASKSITSMRFCLGWFRPAELLFPAQTPFDFVRVCMSFVSGSFEGALIIFLGWNGRSEKNSSSDGVLSYQSPILLISLG
ncbi:655_t:CDS:2, partial [Dentiscutata heterogama]